MNEKRDLRAGAPPGRRRAVVLAAILAALAGPAALADATAGAPRGEARSLRWGIEETAELARRRLSPPARRLALRLPAGADRLRGLVEPANTTQTQVGIALDQLQQMSALVYDPHYLPALVAVGRAFTAVSGRDPFTGTLVNPEYSGLSQELGTEGAVMERSGTEAVDLSRAVRRVGRRLTALRRRVLRLESELRRARGRQASLPGVG